jgi:hypothetical protein
MIVDAQVWHWSRGGMAPGSTDGNSYIELREVERLLEEAHQRGFQRGEQYAKEEKV